MATYVKAYNGYIADVPRLWFKRNDGRIFYFDELTQASVSPQVNYTEINAGWSLYPVAYLPGQSTFEMQITSGKFEADLFTMTNAVNFAENTTYTMPITERLTIDADNKVTLAKTPAKGTVTVAGLSEAASSGNLVTGKFSVTIGDDSTPSTVQFFAGDVENDVIVSYEYTETVQEALIDNRTSAIGEAILKYPVYSNGDEVDELNNGIASSINGYVIMRVYKCRVTAQPGLDGSYKSAATYNFTLSAMDAKRPDEAVYSIAYVKE